MLLYAPAGNRHLRGSPSRLSIRGGESSLIHPQRRGKCLLQQGRVEFPHRGAGQSNLLLDVQSRPIAEAYLSRRSLHRVNGSEQPIDIFGIVVAFERQQTVAHNLQMFLSLWLEKLDDLVGNFIIAWQCVEVRTG